ncbi:RHS repeat-associated core domain-containing protein [Xanthomonas axonopodis pv. poinsettiicola]|uniref:RHS repeat-associated core domain-containing protein n=1 Tax=Xanthomonas TaxID=338 RepID=UPI001E61E5D7|nr:RHS repeat-associated core domain-containing protein [Xanthomonas codiaei]MCC8536224.1 hypothetical protein [Xanthomonas codiaei]
MQLVSLFHVAIDLQHHFGGGGPVAGADSARQGGVDLAQEVAVAKRVAAAGSGVQRPVLLAQVGTDLVGGAGIEDQRYYDPTIPRFPSMDSVTADTTTGGNFNRYWYAANNPYKFIDPDGRCEKTTGSKIYAGSGSLGPAIRGVPIGSKRAGEAVNHPQSLHLLLVLFLLFPIGTG